MNHHLLNKEVQAFLEAHLNEDLDRMILAGSPFENVSAQELAVQIQARRKCKTKLPLWWRTPGIVYPRSLNIEQSSSQQAAEYKATLIRGDKMADLTGGFGVDAYYFARVFHTVEHIEKDSSLHEIVKHNLHVLQASNVLCLNRDSLEYLDDTQVKFDWIYVDPSRRGDLGQRVYQLEDCSPNLLENKHKILSKCKGLLIKLAPFMDVKKAIRQLGNVKEVHVLAVNNEVKELLFILIENHQGPARIKAVHLLKDEIQSLESEPQEELENFYGPVGKYLYEPNVAIRKAGLFAELGKHCGLTKVHPNSHLFTSDKLVDFPGRRFEVIKELSYRPKRIRKELGLTHANITTRNFRESVAQIRKRTGLREGGEHYLFFTTDHLGKPIVLVCTKA